MPGALPVIPAADWDAHTQDQYERVGQEALASIAAVKTAQEQADAAAEEDFTQRAQSQVSAALAPHRDAVEAVSFTQQAQEQVRALIQSVPTAPPAPTPRAGAYPGDTGAAPPPASRSPDAPSGELQDYARAAAAKAGIDPETFVRQIQQESGFNPSARNPSGATGIAQIVPSAHPGVDPTDPRASLDYAANWMGQLTKQYGGDKAKALAAYNAGPGNVEKYGGIPPFEETQRYVKTILGERGGGDALGADAPAPGGRNAIQAPSTSAGAGPRVEALGQFEQGLAAEDAYSICGPVAALAFAQANGRNPDLGEARRLAKETGWTSQGGMNGVANEAALLQKMGVSARLETNPDFGKIAQDAEAGNPVIISTARHYYFVNGFSKETGQLHVGKTGEARKGGGSWMSARQISDLDGGINGALFVDNPASSTPSIAAQEPASAEPPLNDQEPQAAALTQAYQQGQTADTAPAGFAPIGGTPPRPGAQPLHAPGPLDGPDPAGLTRPVIDAAKPAVDWAGDALIGQVDRTNQAQDEADARAREVVAKYRRGEPVSQEEMARSFEDAANVGMVMSGEPLASAGGTVAGRVAGAASEATGAGGLVDRGVGAVRRFFHGSGSAFDRPEGAKFDPQGLFGPGYYLTDDPRVAGSYAGTRAPDLDAADKLGREARADIARLEPVVDYLSTRGGSASEVASYRAQLTDAQERLAEASRPATGPNIRAIDVPAGLNLLDGDAAAPREAVDALRARLSPAQARSFDDYLSTTVQDGQRTRRIVRDDASLEQVRNAYLSVRGSAGSAEANKVLAEAGYDGIRHQGGTRVPMRDDAGNVIEHDVNVIFPESLPKLRNAISGTEGGSIDPRYAADLGGAVGGAGAAQVGADETTPWQERVTRGVLGATAGLGIARGATGRSGISKTLGITPAAGDTLGDVVRREAGLERQTGMAGFGADDLGRAPRDPGTAAPPQPGSSTPRIVDQTPLTLEQPAGHGPSKYDRASLVRMAGMLSGVPTHLFNIAGNTVMGGATLGMKQAQIGVDLARVGVGRALGKDVARQRFQAEMLPQIVGYTKGVWAGLQEVPGILKRGGTEAQLARIDGPTTGLQSGSRVLDAAVEAPLRALLASDAVFRGAAFGGHSAALAIRQATQEGLSGAARTARAQEILGNLSEHPRLLEAANNLAARDVFQEARAVTDAIGTFKRAHVGARVAGDIVLPFYKTPYNVAAQGSGLTPLGYFSALQAARNAARKAEAVALVRSGAPIKEADRKAHLAALALPEVSGQVGEAMDRAVRATAGTAALGIGLTMAGSGALTGPYPQDAAERATLPEGWKPYSIRIPRGDGAIYVPIVALGAFAVPLGVAANAHDGIRRGRESGDVMKGIYAGMAGLGKFMLDASAFQGLIAVSKLATEPERSLEAFTESMAASAVPYSALMRNVQQALGDAQRDPSGPHEAFLAAIPGLSQFVPEKHTALGDTRQRGVSGPMALVTGSRVGVEIPDATLTALREADVNIPAPPKTVGVSKVPLSEPEQLRHQEVAGKLIRSSVGAITGDDRWAALPLATRQKVLQGAVEHAREAASTTLMGELGSAEISRRIRARSPAP